MVVGGWPLAYMILVSAPGPFGTFKGWVGVGIEGLGTKGFGPGLNNINIPKLCM